MIFFLFKWSPHSCDLCVTSAPTCTHLPTFFSHTSMTITRYWGLIKVEEWHEQHFKEAINQRAQTHSSLQLPLTEARTTHHSLLKDRRSHFNWKWERTGKEKQRRQPYTFLLNSSHTATAKTSTVQHARYARLSNTLTVKLRPLLLGNFNKYMGCCRKQRTWV